MRLIFIAIMLWVITGSSSVSADQGRPGATGPHKDFKQADWECETESKPREIRDYLAYAEVQANADDPLPRDEAQYQDGVKQDTPRSLPPGALGPARTVPSTAEKPEIISTLNVPYGQSPGVGANLLSLDIYAPQGAKGLPVMVYVHGGFWMLGDKTHTAHMPAFFCGHGFVFVSVNYRLSPAVKHPVHIEDVARAVAWVHDHIAQHGGDPAQILLMGHSAGGHLVALLGTDARRLGECGKPLSILRGVILLDPAPLDIRDAVANERRTDRSFRAVFGEEPAAWADASPIVHAARAKDLPPFQIVIASGPALAKKKSRMEVFAAVVREAGSRAEIVDASAVRNHRSLRTEFGAADDPVCKSVLEFIESVRCGKADPGLDAEPTLQRESRHG